MGLGPPGAGPCLSGRGLGLGLRRASIAPLGSGPRRQRLHVEPDAVLRPQDEFRLPSHLARPVHAQAKAQQSQRHSHAHLSHGEALSYAVPGGRGTIGLGRSDSAPVQAESL